MKISFKKAFSFMFVVGLAVGAGLLVNSEENNHLAQAAEGKTIYCKMEHSWWTVDGAAVGAHYWGGSVDTSWPGERMTPVASDPNVWKITIPEEYENIIFTRVNPSGTIADWGAKTKDLTIPSDGKNLFTITNSSETWGDPGCDGVWSEYTEPAPDIPEEDGFYLVGSKTGWKFDGAPKLTELEGEYTAALMEYDATKDEEFKVRSYFSSEEVKEQWYGVGDDGNENYVVAEDSQLDIYVEGNHLKVEKSSTPVEHSYYLVGDMNGWTASEEYKLELNEEQEKYVEYTIKFDLGLDCQFKVLGIAGEEDTYFGFEQLDEGEGSARKAGQIVEGEENSNMKAALAGEYTMYFKPDAESNKIWIGAIEVEHDYSLTVTHSDTTTEDVKLIPNVDSEFMTEKDVEVVAGDTLAFYIDGELQTVNPKTIGNNNCHSEDGVLTVTVNMNAKIYVDFATGTCFCGGLEVNKYYMTVDNNVFSLAHNATPVDPSFDEWYVEGVHFSKGAVVRFVNTLDTLNNATQFDILELNDSSKEGLDVVDNKLVCVADGGVSGNVYLKLKFEEDEIYFGDISEDLAQAIDYANIFNAKLAHVCKGDNTTDLNALEAAWADCEKGYGLMLEATQNILKSATAEHSNESIREFAKKYDYVFAKYSAALKLNNFAERNVSFNQDAYAIGLASSESANISVITVIVVSVLATSLAALIILNRKKRLK